MQNKYKHIDRFIKEEPAINSRQWLKVENIEIYLRSTSRYIEGREYKKVIDIANIIANGKQMVVDFYNLINHIIIKCRETDIEIIYIENVLEEKLIRAYTALGFKLVDDPHNQHITPCLFMKLK